MENPKVVHAALLACAVGLVVMGIVLIFERNIAAFVAGMVAGLGSYFLFRRKLQ